MSIIRAVRSWVVHTRRAPGLAQVYRASYHVAARIAAAQLSTLPHVASIYARHSYVSGDWEAGLSDVDLTVVAAGDIDAAWLRAFARRYARLRRALPMLGEVQVTTRQRLDHWLSFGGMRARGAAGWRLLAGHPQTLSASAPAPALLALDRTCERFEQYGVISRLALRPHAGVIDRVELERRVRRLVALADLAPAPTPAAWLAHALHALVPDGAPALAPPPASAPLTWPVPVASAALSAAALARAREAARGLDEAISVLAAASAAVRPSLVFVLPAGDITDSTRALLALWPRLCAAAARGERPLVLTAPLVPTFLHSAAGGLPHDKWWRYCIAGAHVGRTPVMAAPDPAFTRAAAVRRLAEKLQALWCILLFERAALPELLLDLLPSLCLVARAGRWVPPPDARAAFAATFGGADVLARVASGPTLDDVRALDALYWDIAIGAPAVALAS
jgi:hypothetical protein